MNREPALIGGVIGALISLLVVYRVLDAHQAAAWGAFGAALIPLLQGIATRFFVMPVSKIRDAGLHPSQVDAVADDPSKSFEVVSTAEAVR